MREGNQRRSELPRLTGNLWVGCIESARLAGKGQQFAAFRITSA